MTEKETINKFYTSFQQLDAESMASCYHNNIEFEDPAFGKLNGEHAKNMWRMLCKNSKDLIIDFEITYDKSTKWDAHYTFSQTGKIVHNKITARFEFKDGLIIKHTDNFNLHSWAKQALGFKGWLLGNTSFFKKKLNQQTAHLLSKFENQ